MRETITVNIKLFSGIEEESNLSDYDPKSGVDIITNKGTRLKKILKDIGLRKLSDYLYFYNGERVSLRIRLNDRDKISCLRPSGGG